MGDDEIETAMANGVSVFSKEVFQFCCSIYCHNDKGQISLESVKRRNWLSVT
jgi:hypothetical protein